MFSRFCFIFILLFGCLFASGCANNVWWLKQRNIYVVQRGDSLWSIGEKFEVSIAQLKKWNSISNGKNLAPGMEIFLGPGEVGAKKIYVAKKKKKVFSAAAYSPGHIRDFLFSRVDDRNWVSITIHHSGGTKGSAKSFHNDHKHKYKNGLFYHFVIGNGTNTKNGEIEVGPRWTDQIEVNRSEDIQISLVGDYTKQKMTKTQFNSLVKLVRSLMDRYDIPDSRIRTHKDVPKSQTLCPGKNFPILRLRREINNVDSLDMGWNSI